MGNVYEADFETIWHGEAYQDFRHQLVTERPQLNGCNTCPRNDTVGLKTLSRIKPLLGSAA